MSCISFKAARVSILAAFVAAACAAPSSISPRDEFAGCDGASPRHDVLNAFWTDLDRRYAVFDIRLTEEGWADVGARGCAQIEAGMSDAALYDVLLGMAQALDDGHINLIAPSLDRDEAAEVTLYPHYEQVYGLRALVAERYLDSAPRNAANDKIAWGRIGDVGYVSITSMDGLGEGGEEGEAAAAATAMRAAMADLEGAAGVIVDIRANEGGYDAVSLEIAAWFAGPRAVAWRERRRNGPDHMDFAAPTDTFVDATREGGFIGPVIVLTSGGTYSAAETFLLAMDVRDDVTVMGEATSGHFSDWVMGDLPNGWRYSFSGERYLTPDGEIHEGPGFPPDIAMALDTEALAQGRDVMLEAALGRLR